jgi:hypothetical protein
LTHPRARTRQGWRGFYSGWVPQLAKTAPSAGLIFLFYEKTMTLLS